MSVVLVVGVAACAEARGPFVGTFSLRARGTIVRVPLLALNGRVVRTKAAMPTESVSQGGER